MLPSAAKHDESQSKKGTPMKFMYATGAQPLDGYTIKRGVGRGGFGEVYFAESDAGKEVAMKLIRRNLDVELRGVRHCLNLKHHNLISLYDIRTDESGDEWVIMEYVSGPADGGHSLEDAIDRNPEGMPEDEVLAWMRGITAGVAYLHDSGIVHRDLKPGNIFLDGGATQSTDERTAGGTVKIGDYGLSKFISCSRRSGQTESVGTVHYMAPEISNGRYGREIDTYALGIILYEMLTGRVPFEGESVGEVLMKHLTAEPDLTVLAEPYQEIVRRALAKDPDVRLRSVGEMVAMLPGSGSSQVDLERSGSHEQAESSPTPAGKQRNWIDDKLLYGPLLVDSGAPISADPRRTQPPEYEGEPIWRSVSEGWDHFWRRWHASDMNPIARGLVTLGGVCVLVFTSGVWIPALVSLGFFYLIYYCIWSWFLEPEQAKHSVHREPQFRDEAQASAAKKTVSRETLKKNRHVRAAERKRRRMNWREQARKELVAKSKRTKAVELIGSMLKAAAVSVGLSIGAAALFSGMTDSTVAVVAAWLAWVSTLGSWAVLITNKFTEGHVEDQVPMRGLLLALGMGVGIFAFMLNQGLNIGLPYEKDMGPGLNGSLAHNMLNLPSYGQPERLNNGVVTDMGMSIAYFASLLVALRWWKQAEWTRERRLSLWNIALCVGFAWLLHMVWWYPQPTGMLVAGIVAASTQLASPWLPPSRRAEMARGNIAA